jgi:hypothetical protein
MRNFDGGAGYDGVMHVYRLSLRIISIIEGLTLQRETNNYVDSQLFIIVFGASKGEQITVEHARQRFYHYYTRGKGDTYDGETFSRVRTQPLPAKQAVAVAVASSSSSPPTMTTKQGVRKEERPAAGNSAIDFSRI